MRGKRIAVLESRLGPQLVEMLAQRGALPVHAPALAELPDIDPAQIGELVRSLRSQPPRLAIFQTGVGTRALFGAADSLGVAGELLQLLASAVVVARGPKPAGALRARGVRIDRLAADPFTTREVLAAIADVQVAGERALIQRHGAANVELDRVLEARGARVSEIPTYRWALPADTAPLASLVGALERGEIDAAAFTNAEQARNLFLVAGQLGRGEALRRALNGTLVASIGPVASAALREAGVAVDVEASPPKLGALLSALEGALA